MRSSLILLLILKFTGGESAAKRNLGINVVGVRTGSIPRRNNLTAFTLSRPYLKYQQTPCSRNGDCNIDKHKAKRSHRSVCNPTIVDQREFPRVGSGNTIRRNSHSACIIRSSTTLSLSVPLISSSDTWGNIATLCSTASVAQGLGKTTAVGRLLGPPVTAMAIAFALGSIGILPPGGSQGSKILQLLSIQLATPLLLLSVNIRDCCQRCGPLFFAFTIAAIATLASSVLATHLCAGPLSIALGSDGLKIAAALMAKNIGGGLNYVAVCRSLGVGLNSIAAGLCVDNVFALVYFPITSALSAGRPDVDDIGSGDKGVVDDGVLSTQTETPPPPPPQQSISTESISKSLALAAIATFLGERIAGQSYALPLSTLLTLLYTTLCPSTPSTLGPTGEAIGTSLLYLFFATAGAPGLSIADSVRSSFLPLACFLTVLYVGHGAILTGTRQAILTWIRRRRRRRSGTKGEEGDSVASAVVAPQRLLVASSASIGGPATAAALAQANGWTNLVGPSLLVGNVGYAVATFMGIVFHSIVSKLYF